MTKRDFDLDGYTIFKSYWIRFNPNQWSFVLKSAVDENNCQNETKFDGVIN